MAEAAAVHQFNNILLGGRGGTVRGFLPVSRHVMSFLWNLSFSGALPCIVGHGILSHSTVLNNIEWEREAEKKVVSSFGTGTWETSRIQRNKRVLSLHKTRAYYEHTYTECTHVCICRLLWPSQARSHSTLFIGFFANGKGTICRWILMGVLSFMNRIRGNWKSTLEDSPGGRQAVGRWWR